MAVWLCDVCQKSMSANSRDSHVAGKKHLNRAARTTINPAPTVVAPPLVPVNTHPTSNSNLSATAAPSQSGSPIAPVSQWRTERCDLCDITIYTHILDASTSHVLSAKHQAKLNGTSYVATPANLSTTGTDGASDSAANITIPSPAKRKRPATESTTSGSSSRGPIKSGGGGVPGRGNGGGGGGGRGTGRGVGGPAPGRGGPGGGGGGGGGNGGRRGRQNRGRGRSNGRSNWELSDEEARGLLYDIDTAFGLLPHGGAYKESNHYNDYGDVMY